MDIVHLRTGHSNIPEEMSFKKSSKTKLPPIRLRPVMGSYDDIYRGQAGSVDLGGLSLGMTNLVDPTHPVYDRNSRGYHRRKHGLEAVSRTTFNDPEEGKEMNPDSVPFALSVFKSSTMIKKVSVPPRHLNTWGSANNAQTTREVVVHTDRYQWDGSRQTPDSLPTPLGNYETSSSPIGKHFMIDGQQAVLFERMDISDELRQLKSIVLPKKAKDLYVGRGFHMPQEHAINKPRPPVRARSRIPATVIGPTPSVVPPSSPTHVDMSKQLKPPSPPVRQKTSEAVTDYEAPPSEATIPVSSVHPADDPSTKPAESERSKSPSPLKSNSLKTLLSPDKFNKLQKTFKRLDSDEDGHLSFAQVKSQFPKTLTSAQERYLKQIYHTSSSATFFGADEFVAMSLIVEEISKLSGSAAEAFKSIDHASLPKKIKQLSVEFSKVDSEGDEFALNDIIHILETVENIKVDFAIQQKIKSALQNQSKMNRMQFLAYFPYFLML